MNAKAVPQIMKPRLVACAVRAADTGMLTEVFESLLHELNRYGPAPTQHEERRAASLRVASFGSTCGILRHDPIELKSEGHQSRLVEFRIAYGDHGAGQIDVFQGE